MPASLADLERDLQRALQTDDPDRLDSVRRTIAEGHPETEAGAEAGYRLGLSALFRQQDLDDAVKWMRAAAKAKSETWSPRARTSLGLLLFRQGKVQQAVFELRRVAGRKPATLAVAEALGYMVIVHRETDNPREADRARTEQLKALRALTKDGDPEVSGLAHYMLAMELKFDGERRPAKEHLEAALKSKGLSDEDRERAQAVLSAL